MSAVDSLKGVTVNAAELMGRNTGALEAGRDADIIAVKDDPLESAAALADPVFVMKRGERIV